MWLRCYKITLLFLISCIGYGQSYKVPDSLRKKTYEELEIDFNNNIEINSSKTGLFAEAYISKSKKENNIFEIANGYYLFCRLNDDNPKITLQYADSIIAITKDSSYKKYPTRGYLYKGFSLKSQGKYNKALEAYLTGLHYAKSKDDLINFIAIKHNIAILKDVLGNYDEALKEYRENLTFIKMQDTIFKYRPHHIATIFRMSYTFNNLEMLDSAHFYVKKGIDLSLSGKKKYYYPALLISVSVNSYKRGKYSVAIDSLKKAIKLIDRKTVAYTYLGKSLLKLKKQDEALLYLKKVDSITHTFNYSPETRDAFTILIDHYKTIKDKNNQLRLLKKLITLDSVTDKKYNRLSINLVKNYDTAKLIKERDNIIATLEKENTKISSQNIIISIFLAVSMLGFGYYYHRQRLYKKRFLKLLDTTTNPDQKKEPSNDVSASPSINKETINHLLDRLQQFEEKQGYLKSNLNAKDLAKSFGSNSSYLSKVVNTFKEKSFSSYVNDLRINYVIDKLREDSIFRKYTVKAIAQEIGFNNAEAFSKAFYKKTGIYPSYFIKELEKQQSI
ncbi:MULTISPECIES: helix-turn-helix domain-containing protein [Aquimarina]|uniref:helix-turn-helix domain-containing protein n=1 Tax=Aquimarina TaxID=290174 RepID=UPI000944751B|nr:MULTISPECIES: helix-turn-helix domain-containing protein [Aquimarina]